jgi:hypothetical protein
MLLSVVPLEAFRYNRRAAAGHPWIMAVDKDKTSA